MLWLMGAVFDKITDVVLLIAEILIALIIVEKVAIAIHNYLVKRREQQVVGQTCQDDEQSDEILERYLALRPGDLQVVGANGQLVAGEYVILADDSVQETFDVSVNGVVGCYCDGDIICLANGDTVCSSDAIVIKLCND